MIRAMVSVLAALLGLATAPTLPGPPRHVSTRLGDRVAWCAEPIDTPRPPIYSADYSWRLSDALTRAGWLGCTIILTANASTLLTCDPTMDAAFVLMVQHGTGTVCVSR